MTRKLSLTVTLAALVGLAAPTFAADTHAPGHDPQAATSTAKPKASKAKAAKAKHAKSSEAKAAKPAAQPAAPAAK